MVFWRIALRSMKNAQAVPRVLPRELKRGSKFVKRIHLQLSRCEILCATFQRRDYQDSASEQTVRA